LKYILFSSFSLVLISCSSKPVLPQKSDIKVSRDEAGKDCKSLGAIEGRTTNVKGTAEEALEDLKSEAIKKGANYVQIETMGAQGTAIRGQAYFCN
jgi:hypothetical protein